MKNKKYLVWFNGIFMAFVLLFTIKAGAEEMDMTKDKMYYVKNGIYQVCLEVENTTENMIPFSFRVNDFDCTGKRKVSAMSERVIKCKVAVTEGKIQISAPEQKGINIKRIRLIFEQENQKKDKLSVYFFGDSTAKYYDKGRIGGMGEGFLKTLKEGDKKTITPIKGRFEGMFKAEMPDMDVYNYSRCGQSTKSMIRRGTLNELLCSVGKGDYVFINLGHNDFLHMKEEIYSSPSEYRQNLERIISDIRICGGIPVLCSPTATCTYRGNRVTSKLKTCEKMMQQVADETGTLYLPVGESHRMYLNAIGKNTAINLYKYKYDGRDTTHMNKAGADVAGRVLACLIKNNKSLEKIAAYIETDSTQMLSTMKNVKKLKRNTYTYKTWKEFKNIYRRQVMNVFGKKADTKTVINSVSVIKRAEERLETKEQAKKRKEKNTKNKKL